MLATQNRTKVIPNKLVLKHEEFIVNKSLASKVRQVKSTINAENKHFEKIIVTRQKRDLQNHSSQSKSRTTIEHPSLENPLNNPYDLRTPHSKEFRVKTTDHPSGKLLREFIMSPVQKIRSETSGGPQSGRGTLGHIFTSPRNMLDKPPLHKGSLPGASYKSAILDRLPEKTPKEIQRTGSLKEQLVEKEMELKYLKDELKDWWHDDFKNGKVVQFKEISIDYDPQSAGLMRTSPERSVEYSVKGAKSTTGKLSTLNHRHNSDSKVKKDPQMDLAKQRDLHLKSVQYTESLRILEKLQERDMSKKKLEPLRKDKENPKEAERRPASEATRKKDDLKMRFSNNFENGGILKLNKRYQSQGVDVINETSDYEKEEPSKEQNEIEEDICEGNSHDSFEVKKPQKISFTVKNINRRYQTHESDHEDEDHTRSESPQIVTTSKTLMLQSRVHNSRTLNKFNLKHPNEDDDENSF